MNKHIKGEAFSFRLPTLARPTYKKLTEMCEATSMTQWDIVTLGIHLAYDRWKAEDKELIMRIRAETKLLRPNSGRAKKDNEHERQTREENGE